MNRFSLRKNKFVEKKHHRSLWTKCIIFVMVFSLLLPTSLQPVHAQAANEHLFQPTQIELYKYGEPMENKFNVFFSGDGNGEKHMVGNGSVVSLHVDLSEVPEEAREELILQAVTNAQVDVKVNPVRLGMFSRGFHRAFGSLMGELQDDTINIFEFVDQITRNNVVSRFVIIKGLREYNRAFDEFRRLENSQMEVDAFTNKAPIEIDGDNMIVTIDFTEEVNNHLYNQVESQVDEAAVNYIKAIKDIEIAILPGVPFVGSTISFFVNGIYQIVNSVVLEVNQRILGPLAEGVLEGMNLGNREKVTGYMVTVIPLQFANAKSVCIDGESIGHGEFNVPVKGLYTEKPVSQTEHFNQVDVSENLNLTIGANEDCAMNIVGEVQIYRDYQLYTPEEEEELTEQEKAKEAFRNNERGTNQGERPSIDRGKRLDRDIQRNENGESNDANDKSKDLDRNESDEDVIEATEEMAEARKKIRESLEKRRKDKLNRGGHTGTNAEADETNADHEQEASETEADDVATKEQDEEADNTPTNNDESINANDTENSHQTDSSSESLSDLDIDIEDIEEGIGMLKRILQLILEILEKLTASESQSTNE